jgi:hypothetical protein
MRDSKSDLKAINEALKRAKDRMETLALALPYMARKSADARTFSGSERADYRVFVIRQPEDRAIIEVYAGNGDFTGTGQAERERVIGSVLDVLETTEDGIRCHVCNRRLVGAEPLSDFLVSCFDNGAFIALCVGCAGSTDTTC